MDPCLDSVKNLIIAINYSNMVLTCKLIISASDCLLYCYFFQTTTRDRLACNNYQGTCSHHWPHFALK